MESKDELTTLLINSLESLTKRIDKLEDQLKKNTEVQNKNISSIQELNVTILNTNKIFDEVSSGITNLYEKVKGLEMWSKLLGNLGPLLGGMKK